MTSDFKNMYRLSDYDYGLPEDLIAQRPASRRDQARLLVLKRKEGSFSHQRFYELTDFLRQGDVLVLNDTKVIPARLLGLRPTGGKVEILILKKLSEGRRYVALLKPRSRLKDGEEITLFGPRRSRAVCRIADAKNKIIEFSGVGAEEIIKKNGLLPLPPYIRRQPDAGDKRRYQTVFADKEGAVAAPTAGLHFTGSLLARLRRKGVETHFLTLHVNYATFSPLRLEDIRAHAPEPEFFEIPLRTLRVIGEAKAQGRRICAVGTTVCKALEDGFRQETANGAGISKWSSLFIYPPFHFKVVDMLITNFHLPRTSLLMLVSAFAGRDLIFRAYAEAIRQRYRFYSYGDAMLIV